MNKNSTMLLVTLLFGGGLAAGLGISSLGNKTEPNSDGLPTGPGPATAKKGGASAKDQGKPERYLAKAPEKPPAREEKASLLPPDRGTDLLTTLLAAYRLAPPSPTGFAAGPRPQGESSTLPIPDLPLAGPGSRDPYLPGFGGNPEIPPRPTLPGEPRVRLPAPDLDRPVPLLPLGQGPTDRGIQLDPTTAISAALALARTVPYLANPAPFLRLILPDPFENRQAIRLTHEPTPEQLPLTAGSPAPRR